MKDSFKANIIIFLLILVVVLAFVNIYMNKQLVNSYTLFRKEDDTIEDNNINKSNADILEFDLKIKYGQDKIKLEYDIDSNDLVKAKYKNEITSELLRGQEAEKIFNEQLKDINFTAPQSQVIDLILNNLNLDSNFTEFELEVEYNDGTKVDFDIEN